MTAGVGGRLRSAKRRLLFGVGAGLLPLASMNPAHASVTTEDIVELTDVDGLSVSPDGRFAVFRTERGDVGLNTYVLRWYSVDLKTETVRDIGSGGDVIYVDPGLIQAETPLWTSDGRSIVVRRLIDGRVGLWRADVGGHGMTPIVNGDADVIDYSMSPDRTAVLYTVGATRDQIRLAEKREYDSGILVDSTIDLMENMFRGAWINGRMSSQRLTTWWVKDGLLWRTPRQQHRVDLATGSDTAVGKPQDPTAWQLPIILPPVSSSNDEGDLAVGQYEDGAGQVSAKLADGRKIVCEDPLCHSTRVASLAWLPGSHELLVTFVDRERRESLYLWNIEANKLRKIAANDGLLSGGRRDSQPCAVSARDAICVAAGPISPPRLERVDLSTGSRTVLFDPNARLRSAYRADVRFLEWSAGGGKEAGGVLLEPPGHAHRPAPLYLNYYICDGFLRGGEGDEWPIPQLLDAGYAVACINVLPITGPQHALQTYSDGFAAVQALVKKLSAESIIDPSKVAMGGLSFGSEVAFWTAFHSHLLAALSVTSPSPEPASYWSESMPGSAIPAALRRVWGYGAPDETPKNWRANSVAMNVDKIRIPVLFQMPEMEARRVPELYVKLSREGTPTELYAFPDEMHLKVQPRHKLAVYDRNLDWFRYWLEDYRDPDPSKAAQYRRWDELRKRWKSSTAKNARTVSTARAQQSH